MNAQSLDYVKYDEKAQSLQDSIKSQCLCVGAMLNTLEEGRSKSLAFTKLEEFYMWVGKAIRDDQLKRDSTREAK